jgi:hypothetical protein
VACKNWHQLPPGPLKYPKAYEYEKGSFLLVPPGIILVYMLSSEQFEKHFWKVLWNSIIGGPFVTVPELLFEKKGLVPAIQQLLVGVNSAT